MFGFIKKVFFVAMSFFSCNVLNAIPLDRVSTNNEECTMKPEIININSNELLFFRYIVNTNKCSGTCNNISYSYEKMCVPNIVKNINVKVFNLISRTNETRYIEWHEPCKCKYRLDASVCNNKQRWNKDKCRCECKELIHKAICDKEFIAYIKNVFEILIIENV